MTNDLVYSTSQGKQKKKKGKEDRNVTGSQTGPCKMRLEKKGKGGKQVTVLFNLPFSELEAKTLMKALQAYLACGASYKGGEILFSGDMREKIMNYFKTEGLKLVQAGG